MDQNNYHPPNDTASNKEWFDAIPEPIQPLQPSPNRPKKKRIIIALLATLLLLGGVTTTFGVNYFSREPCLTSEDYAIFTGKKPDSQLSPQSFYTQSIEFDTATNTPVDKQGAQKLLDRVASFYVEHADDRSIMISVSSDYSGESTEKAANTRIDLLKSELAAKGIDIKISTRSTATGLSERGDLVEEFDTTEPALAYVSISSSPECR